MRHRAPWGGEGGNQDGCGCCGPAPSREAPAAGGPDRASRPLLPPGLQRANNCFNSGPESPTLPFPRFSPPLSPPFLYKEGTGSPVQPMCSQPGLSWGWAEVGWGGLSFFPWAGGGDPLSSLFHCLSHLAEALWVLELAAGLDVEGGCFWVGEVEVPPPLCLSQP